MSLQIPTTAALATTILAQFETAFGQTVPLYLKAFLRVTARVWAGMLITLYKYAGSSLLQQFVQYASYQEVTINGKKVIPLVDWGRLTGTGDPTAATRAEYTIDVLVDNQVGSLPANTQLINTDNGVTYLTLAAVPLVASTVQADIRAYNDQDDNGGKGTVGNLSVGDIVTFINPIPSVQSVTTVAVELVTGADAEDWEVYRTRVIDRFRQQPQGGAYADYEQWGETVEGIINVYPYTGGPGEVDVYSEATIASSGSADGIPTSAQLLAVKAAIEVNEGGLASRRPVNAFINSDAITRTGFDVVVTGITGVVSVATVEDAVEAALVSYFWGRAPFIPGLTLGKRRDRITDTEVGGVVNDIVVSYNGIFTSVTISEGGGPDFNLHSLGEGETAKLESVSFV